MEFQKNVKWSEVKWSDWSEVKWSDWSEVKWSELNWSELNWSELKWIEVNWSEVIQYNIHSGLCNGTRLIVENIQPHCITSKIITGPGKNNIALIPRINLTPSNTRLPFTFSRRQFPVKLAYAMTINKSQGQSLTKVGIYLPQCVFSHGQLYVAFSRAQDPENVKTFIIPIENKQGPMPSPLNNTYTSNVVYRNVLLWFDH